MMFRDAANPGKVKATLVNAAFASLKIFGTPNAPSLTRLVWTDPVQVPEDVRKKLVGKLNPLPGPKGNPECHRAAPVISHPPIAASTKRLALPRNLRPLPNGRSTAQ